MENHKSSALTSSMQRITDSIHLSHKKRIIFFTTFPENFFSKDIQTRRGQSSSLGEICFVDFMFLFAHSSALKILIAYDASSFKSQFNLYIEFSNGTTALFKNF